MKHASEADRDYFARVARANLLLLDEDRPPDSLDEMFDRLERTRRQLGALAVPGIPAGASDDADLGGHLHFLARMRSAQNCGSHRT